MWCEVCKQEHRSLAAIASDVRKTWTPKVNYAAEPYLSAMRTMRCPQEMYMYDTGRSIVLYFLSNASTFRGPEARRLKTELRVMLRNTKEARV